MPFLSAHEICMDFGSVRVLDHVNFDVKRGEVHALIGENGAGKSTLMRILSGYYRPTLGRLSVDGVDVNFHHVGDAERHGIVMIHQEFNLADDLTVAENIFLGREIRRGLLLNKAEMERRAREALAELDTVVNPKARVRELTISQKQMVEVAKAMSRNARVMIMDEPTAVLTPHEVDSLFRLIKKLVADGVSVIYISHKLSEVHQVADRVTVLRDGRWVTTRPAKELTPYDMASLMVGRDLKTMFPPKQLVRSGPPLFSVRNVTVDGWAYDCSFHVKPGEIVGFAGLVGAGRTELMEGVFALRPRKSGEIFLGDQPVQIKSNRDAVGLGLVYLSEDRNGKALITEMNLAPNVTLMSLRKYCKPMIDKRAEIETLKNSVEQFDIRIPSLTAKINMLSGGNRQKIALAKMMETAPRVIVIDEPTRGIDVGTKEQVYRFIHELASMGKACIVISSDLQEVIGLSHRVIVMRQGRITGELSADAINEQEIMRYATGVKGVA